jgi:hypothetical protein
MPFANEEETQAVMQRCKAFIIARLSPAGHWE